MSNLLQRQHGSLFVAGSRENLPVFLPGENFIFQFFRFNVESLSGNQCRTEGAHDSGNIRTHHVLPQRFFKGTEHRIIVEGSALHNDVLSEIFRIRHFNNLIQGVLNDRVCQSCRDIGNGCPFFLCLLYVRVHENGTTGTEIRRIFGEKRFFRKILHTVI